MSLHAKLSPSGSNIWLNCAGSPNICEGLPDPPNVHSMRGSIAHCLGETCLVRNDNPDDYMGYWGWDNGKGGNGVVEAKPSAIERLAMVIQVDEKMAEDVALYVNTVRATREEMPGAQFFVEKKLDLRWLVPGMFGTADHAAIEFMGRACIDDYKNGIGLVEVEDNSQFMIYALGAVGEGNPHMVEEVMMRVVQPNGMHSRGPVRSHIISVDELMGWGFNTLKPGAERTKDQNAPRTPGEWCKWCKAKRAVLCPEHRAFVLKSVDVMFDKAVVPIDDTPTLMDPVEMSGEQLDKILKVSSIVKDWAKVVEEEGRRRLEAGAKNAPKSQKLVLGKKSRKWGSDDAEIVVAASRLGIVNSYESKIKSVAQMEKALKAVGAAKDSMKSLVKVSQGKTMVPIDDKRPALLSGPDEMFK